MKFDQNQPVYALVKTSDDAQQRWQEGRYERYLGGNAHHVKVKGKGYQVENNQIATLERLDDEQLHEAAALEYNKLFAYLKDAIDTLLPGMEWATIRNGTGEPSSIDLMDGAIVIEPVAIPVQRIGKFVEHPGWMIGQTIIQYQTRDEPESADVKELDVCRNAADAASKALQHMFRVYADAYWTGVGENEAADAWEDDPLY